MIGMLAKVKCARANRNRIRARANSNSEKMNGTRVKADGNGAKSNLTLGRENDPFASRDCNNVKANRTLVKVIYMTANENNTPVNWNLPSSNPDLPPSFPFRIRCNLKQLRITLDEVRCIGEVQFGSQVVDRLLVVTAESLTCLVEADQLDGSTDG